MTLVVVVNHIGIILANNQFFGSQTDLTEDDFRNDQLTEDDFRRR